MYYEEKYIDGVLYYRYAPKGEFFKASVARVYMRLHRMEEKVKELETQLRELEAVEASQ